MNTRLEKSIYGFLINRYIFLMKMSQIPRRSYCVYFGLEADCISNNEKINEHLATSQSLMNKEIPDDGEEEIN